MRRLAVLLAGAALSLASSAAAQPGPGVSSCNDQPNADACVQATDDKTGTPCEWCVAGAIPSECMSAEQAKLLPSGVFECQSPGLVDFGVGVTARVNVKEHDAGEDFCDASSRSRSGYIDIKGSKYDTDGQNKHLFFWMFEKRNMDRSEQDPSEIPFIIWLTGGPGCSSTLALLTENGPCSVNDDGATTTPNPYSWTEAAHVLWLDQPAGVGFSYGTEDDTNEEQVSEDAYWFVQTFMSTYPEYQNNPLFIVGESYGGHYAPAIAHRIFTYNQHPPSGKTRKLNLAGLAVGNGLTKPEEQYKWYPEMVFNNSHHIQVVSESVYSTMKGVVPRCTQLIAKCNEGDSMIDTFACQSAFLVCNLGLTSPYQATGLNPYDIRKECAQPPLCYDFSHIEKWLNSESTKKALNVDEKHSHAWKTCNFGINMQFRTDWMKDFSPFVADLLNGGIPTLIYAGDVDFICNYLGNKAWTYQLEWDGKKEFQQAEEHDWKDAGSARSAKGFTFLQVFDAGHMVPTDQPEVALDLIRAFINGEAF